MTHCVLDESYLSFFVPGSPMGKGRARSFIRKKGKKKNKIGHYTPGETRIYEKKIAWIARSGMNIRDPLECPVFIILTFIMPISPSWPKWKKEAAISGVLWPTVKPDADNIEKAIKDACNKVVWKDDSYVVGCNKLKRYAKSGEEPGVFVNVKCMSGFPIQVNKNDITK